jgi:hypothetical protein
MSSQIKQVEPTVINGIEFYVANQGTACGTSQRGCARLTGKPLTTIQSLITEISRLMAIRLTGVDNEESTASAPIQAAALVICKGLEGDPILDIPAVNGAKIINSKFVSRIVRYYAFEDANTNETAKFSYDKFAEVGIDTWIKEVTGASIGGDFSLVQKSLNRILDSLTTTNARLTSLEQKTNGYIKASIEMPGLKTWMDTYTQEETSQLTLPDGELVTLSEYLWNEKRLKFDKPAMGKFANKVSYVYQTMAEERPDKKRGVTLKGYKTPLTNAYRRRDYPLLDIAFKQTVLEL